MVITAWSGVGKTTTGDFLGEYCGFHHLDGDEDMRSPDAACKDAAAGLISSFSDYWFKDKDAPPELWHPYYSMLCDKCAAAAQEHADVVVSISVYRREVRDFLRNRMGDLSADTDLVILKLECDLDRVVQSAIDRLSDFMALSGKTVEDSWNGPSMFPGVCYLDKYGEYSFEAFKKMQLEFFLSGMEAFGEDEPGTCLAVDVSSRDVSAFDGVRDVLNLPPTTDEVDLAALREIQKARWVAWRRSNGSD